MISPDLLQRLCRARARLQAELEPPARISALARDAGLTTPHFITQFSAVFGETPLQCRTRARLERACELLRGDEPVSQVALALGFANLGSFSRLFTRRFGVPPRAWRRRRAAAPASPAGCMALMNAAWLAQRNSGEVRTRA